MQIFLGDKFQCSHNFYSILNFRFHVLPGIGNFGDRYFGTEYKHLTYQVNDHGCCS